MDTQQEIFTSIRGILVELFGEENVYDGSLPPEGTPYPFAYVANAVQIDRPVKFAVIGEVTQTVHIFHDKTFERGTLSRWIQRTKQKAWQLDATSSWSCSLREIDTRIIDDHTTNTPLLHGVMIFKFQYS